MAYTLVAKLGSIVCGISLKSDEEYILYNSLSEEFKSFDDSYEEYEVDIRNKNYMQKIIVDFKPDIVIHLAAQALVKKAIESPSLLGRPT